jgi:hypothetical protein
MVFARPPEAVRGAAAGGAVGTSGSRAVGAIPEFVPVRRRRIAAACPSAEHAASGSESWAVGGRLLGRGGRCTRWEKGQDDAGRDHVCLILGNHVVGATARVMPGATEHALGCKEKSDVTRSRETLASVAATCLSLVIFSRTTHYQMAKLLCSAYYLRLENFPWSPL